MNSEAGEEKDKKAGGSVSIQNPCPTAVCDKPVETAREMWSLTDTQSLKDKSKAAAPEKQSFLALRPRESVPVSHSSGDTV